MLNKHSKLCLLLMLLSMFCYPGESLLYESLHESALVACSIVLKINHLKCSSVNGAISKTINTNLSDPVALTSLCWDFLDRKLAHRFSVFYC